jgi:sugar (pentulose or hexulose) kinase
MGISRKAETGVVTGWSVPVQMVTPEPVLDIEGRIWTGCYIPPDSWILESNTGEAGNAFRWLRETVFTHNGVSSETSYDIIDKEALEAPPGAQGVVASAGPGIMDMAHLGMDYGGILFPLPLSVSGIRRGHLARAVLENICFAVKANLLQVETLAGLKADTIFIGGNMTRSSGFRRMLPDILDRSVRVAGVQEVSALGNAMLAAAGSGIYSGINEAMAEMRSEMTVYEPDILAAAEYAEHYQQWLEIVKKLQELRGVVN